MRNRQKIWVLLQKKENGLMVYRYEPLRKKQISIMEKQGWSVEMRG